MRRLLLILGIIVLARLGLFVFVEWRPTWPRGPAILDGSEAPSDQPRLSQEAQREANLAFRLGELKSEYYLDRAGGALYLGEFKDERAIVALVAALEDSHPRVRDNAAKSLGEIGPMASRAAPRLAQLIELDEDSSVRFAAFSSLGAMGSPAWPTILAGLRNLDTRIRTEYGYALDKMSPAEKQRILRQLIELTSDPDLKLRGVAAHAIGEIGESAADAIPALVREMKSGRDDAGVFGSALRQIGPAAIPALLDGLVDPNPNIRSVAVLQLGHLGPNDTVWPKMITALQDPQSTVRGDAVVALCEIAPSPADAMPHLLAALKDPDEGVRGMAVVQLGLLGPDAAEGLPAMLGELSRIDPEDQFEIIKAIGNIGPQAVTAVPAILRAFQNDKAFLKIVSAEALSSIGPGAKDAIPALIAFLDAGPNDDEPVANYAIVETLGTIGSASPEIVAPASVRILPRCSSSLRRVALQSLEKVGPASDDAIRAFVAALTDDDSEVREAAAAALADRGHESPIALPAIIERIKIEEDVLTLRGLLTALVPYGPLAKEAVGVIYEAFAKDDFIDEHTIGIAAQALAAIDPMEKEWIPVLTKALFNPQGTEGARVKAARALGLSAARSAAARKALEEAVATLDDPFRQAAIEALDKAAQDAEAPQPEAAAIEP